MKILKTKIQTEIVVKKSRFIAEAFPCESQNAAKKIIREQKEKYFSARHVVHAFVIGKDAEILGASDDGEPSGTAGQPVLRVIKGSGISNILVTITRYFGGVLLGTGGLAKAYGEAARTVLENAAKENAIEKYVPKKEFSFSCDFAFYKNVKIFFEKFFVSEIEENFSEEVFVKAKIAAKDLNAFSCAINELSKGQVLLKIEGEK